MNCVVKPLLLAAWVCTVATMACESRRECSPCPPGTHPQDTTQWCSVCVSDSDAGTDDVASKDADTKDTPGDGDASNQPDSREAGAPDGPITPACEGDLHLFCTQGGPLGDGFACSDVAQFPICSDGHWQCPPGTTDGRFCTCSGAPFPGCSVCTRNGWRCPDAGTDADGADGGGAG